MRPSRLFKLKSRPKINSRETNLRKKVQVILPKGQCQPETFHNNMQLSDKGVRVSIIHTCNFKIVQTVSSLFPRCQNDRSLKMIHAAWVMVRQPGPWYMTYHYVREDLMSVITWRTRLVKIRHVFMLKWQIDKVSFHSNNKLIQVGSIWVQHSSHQIMLNSKTINS